MEIKKGDIRYTISELTHEWKVVAHMSDTVGLTYKISKELCAACEDVIKYINDNSMFAG